MGLIQDVYGLATDPKGFLSRSASGGDQQQRKKRQADLDPGQIPGQETQSVPFPQYDTPKRSAKRSNGKSRD